MRILYISSDDLDGQRFNGYVLLQQLTRLGHEVDMGVYHKESTDPAVHVIGHPIVNRLNNYLYHFEHMLGWQSVLPISALSLFASRYYRSAEIVHLQLLHTAPFFSLLLLPAISRKKALLWTIHDAWLTSGHCVHALDCGRWLTGCGKCPDLSLPIPVTRDSTAFCWRLKRLLMKRSAVSLIVASRWMYQKVQLSPVLGHLPCQLIPFGVDTGVFRPLDREKCRDLLGIPQENHVLAFRAKTSIYKGSQYLEEALALYHPSRETTLLIIEEKEGMPEIRLKYSRVELGWVSDQYLIAQALSAADVFIMPSIAESFGMMAVEAMACGTPVICFEGTSIPEVIHAPRGGLAVPYKDCGALAYAIGLLLADQCLRESLGRNGVEIVREQYTVDLYVKRHIDFYQSILDSKHR